MEAIKKHDTIQEKKQDADTFIMDVLKKIPAEKKIEALRLLEGFALNASDQKAG